MQLEGKAVLLTGAGSGIGRALAIQLAARGADLLLVGRRAAPLEETAALAAKGGRGSILSLAADITTAEGRGLIRAAVGRRLGRLDLLINNAGTLVAKPFAETSDAELEGLAATNLVAPLALTRDLLADLRASGGRIVNVGSMFGEIAFPLFAAYSATKFGLRGASDALRRELAPEGICVTHVAPRATRTGLTAAFAALVEPFAMKLDAAETVAARIIATIEHDRDRMWPGPAERLFALLQAIAPKAIDGGIGAPFRKWLAAQSRPVPADLKAGRPVA